MKKTDSIYNLEVVADLLSVTRQTVLDWHKTGKLKSVSSDEAGKPLFEWSELLKFDAVREMQSTRWDEQHTVKPVREFRSIELFAGAGGLALGLEKAGFRHVALNEMSPDACATLRKNRPEWNVVEGDVSELDFSEVGEVDLVSGGFPCQAFSYAGHGAGFDDARGTLFFEWARVIKETRPRMILGENVRGLLTHDGGKTLEVIKSVIAQLGYTLVEPRVLKAIFYKVPQKRERLLLVGVRNDLLKHFKFEWPDKAERVYTLRDALKAGDLYPSDVPASEGQAYPKRKKEILAMVPPGGYWRDLPDEVQREYMKGSYFLGGGKTGMARRLAWDAPSLTLTCAPAQNQTERCHPQESRPLTVREYARIQTFPDEWDFSGSTASKYKQIGNAVPVNLAHAVGCSIVRALNEIEKAVPQNSKAGKESVSVNHTTKVLVGTYRPENAKWITSRKFYNLPLADPAKADEYRRFSNIVLFEPGHEPVSRKAKLARVVDAKWLAGQGYAVGSNPRTENYALFEMEDEVPVASVLSNPAADIFVCTSEFTGKITKDFFRRELPKCKGESTKFLFLEVKPYFGSCRSVFAFNPVQMDFFAQMQL